MPDIPAQDWRALLGKIDGIAGDLAQVKGEVKVMSSQVGDLRTFQTKADTMINRSYIAGSFILLFSLIIIGGLVSGAQRLTALETAANYLATKEQVATVNDTAISAATKIQAAELKTSLDNQIKKIDKLEGTVEDLVKENKKLSGIIGKGSNQFANVKIFHGTMLSAVDDMLEFMGPDKTQMKFLITKETRIIINGKDADLAELRGQKFVPVHILMLMNDNHAVVIVEVESRKSKF